MVFYDLDGTLSTLNSTFDFIEKYHQGKNNRLRLFFCKNVSRILNRTFMSGEMKRKILIMVYFAGVRVLNLEAFFDEVYRYDFEQSLTLLGQEVLKSQDDSKVLLTGCTSVPAKQIAELFGFKEVISTTLMLKWGRILGISEDTYANKKMKFVKNCMEKYSLKKEDVIYYTDDQDGEKELATLFGEIYYV